MPASRRTKWIVCSIRCSDRNHRRMGRSRFLHRAATLRPRGADLRSVPSSHQRARRVSAADRVAADQSYAVGSAVSAATSECTRRRHYRLSRVGGRHQLAAFGAEQRQRQTGAFCPAFIARLHSRGAATKRDRFSRMVSVQPAMTELPRKESEHAQNFLILILILFESVFIRG